MDKRQIALNAKKKREATKKAKMAKAKGRKLDRALERFIDLFLLLFCYETRNHCVFLTLETRLNTSNHPENGNFQMQIKKIARFFNAPDIIGLPDQHLPKPSRWSSCTAFENF